MNSGGARDQNDREERAGSPRSGQHAGWSSRGCLPHYDAAGECQHIVFRLNDALPLHVVEQLQNAPSNDRLRIAEAFVDEGVGSVALRDPKVASVVADTLLKFDAIRYRLLAWCIMPNHVHALVEQREGWTLGSIVHSWKSFTASEANRLLGRSGRFWAPDYFDRAMRGEAQVSRTIEYIEENPVKAGLCEHTAEWVWSSAKADDPGCAVEDQGRPGSPALRSHLPLASYDR